MTLSQEVCRRARTLIAARLGLDFPEERLGDLKRGLARAVRASPLPAPEPYLAWLAAAPDEDPGLGRLAADLTVGETYFFRDPACFDALEQQVLPSLICARRSEGILRLRLWSAACATGEEPYSLAILLARLLAHDPRWSVTILATDVNPNALRAAERGLYREWSLRATPSGTRERYFKRRADRTFELDPAIRRMVTFAPLNLASDGYPSVLTNTSGMDLVLCRNVLMYFTREAQRATAARLRRVLVSDGWLVVSPAEASAELLDPLVPAVFPSAILYRNPPPPAAAPPPVVVSETAGSETIGREPAGPQSPGLGLNGRMSEPQPLPVPGGGTGPAPVARLEEARALADQGKLEDALRLCEAELACDRLDPETHLLVAAIRQERGEIPAALEALRATLYLAPDCAAAHFVLGGLLLRKGKRRQGRRCMETVVELLGSLAPSETVFGGGGLRAGRLLEVARASLESTA